MKKLYWILCFACLSLSLSVNAQSSAEFCKKYKDDIVSQIEVMPNMRADTDTDDVQCKIWPANPEFALLAWEAKGKSDESDDEPLDSDIEIVLASSTTGKIIYHFSDKYAMFSDALESYGVKLDTAQYKLNKSITAFGVRFTRGHRNGNNQHLNLYILKNKKIKKILTSLQAKMDIYESYENCTADTRKSKSFIIVQDKKVKNGFASLLVKKTLKEGENRLDKQTGVCNEKLLRTTKSSTSLIFDGSKYNIPDDYKAF